VDPERFSRIRFSLLKSAEARQSPIIALADVVRDRPFFAVRSVGDVYVGVFFSTRMRGLFQQAVFSPSRARLTLCRR
jgi:alpha-acetolactate decarboxylase